MKNKKTTFKRLVSNLPYNPSLITQVTFYSKRLKQETSIRRLGFVFIALTMVVQLFAIIAPPTASSAQDVNNDLITGGFANRDQAVFNCIDGNKDYGTILAYYNISCSNVANASTQTIRSTDYGGQLYSMGRLPYGKSGEYGVSINGRTYFMRPLHSWDSGAYSSYKALVGTNNSGTTFMILYDCGNLVIIGHYTPPPPTVKSASCSILLGDHEAGEVLKKGTTMTVRGQYTGANLPAGQTININYDYINLDTGKPVVSPVSHNNVLFKNGLADDSTNASFILNTPGHYQFRTAATWDGGQLIAGSLQGNCLRSVSVEQPPLPPPPPICSDVCLVLSKTASNDSQHVANANGTTAKAGDVITYNLIVKNTGKATVKKFVVQENISDVLDYADVIDLHGGAIDGKNNVRYPAIDIKAGATVTKQITVKVKNPVPQTPVSLSNPGKFDLTMTNVYGNTSVNIHLPGSPIKVTEQLTTSLPNTGPGSNLLIGFVIMSIVGYFFARSRLLSKEIELVRQEAITGA
ncbi:MAG: isopeptide-forming domain-containing fimbrial protein [Candidatus Saccharibacteria bacterium]